MRSRTAGAAVVLALLSACSSEDTTSLGATSTPTGSPTTTPTASSAPAAALTPSPTLSPTPSPTRSAAPRVTRSPSRSPKATASRTPSPTPSPTRAGSTYKIDELAPYRFSPSSLSLRVGDRVLVTNKDSAAHTFTIGSLAVDSGNMAAGATFSYRFQKAGTFSFVCTYHDGEPLNMKGTVKVNP